MKKRICFILLVLFSSNFLKGQSESAIFVTGGYIFTGEESELYNYWKNGYSVSCGFSLPKENNYVQSFILNYNRFFPRDQIPPFERMELGIIKEKIIEAQQNIALLYFIDYYIMDKKINPFLQFGIGCTYSFGGDLKRKVDYSTSIEDHKIVNEVFEGEKLFLFNIEGNIGIEFAILKSIKFYIKGGIREALSTEGKNGYFYQVSNTIKINI